MANPNRAPKSEVRSQLKAAKRWASKQKTKSVPAEIWRAVCPKAAR
jgi:hypothetical protein